MRIAVRHLDTMQRKLRFPSPARPLHSPPDDRRPTLRPPQFGLRTLLVVMTVLGAVFALIPWLPPAGVAILLLFGVSIFCHVAGNAIGTRLRANGDRPIPAPLGRSTFGRPTAAHFAPATRLSQRQSLGWLIVIATVGGIVAGGFGGGVWTLLTSRGPVGPLNVAVGVIAFGVLGGMAAFATVAFVQVMLGAIWQTVKAPSRESISDGSA
jgi:hypothetical protein